MFKYHGLAMVTSQCYFQSSTLSEKKMDSFPAAARVAHLSRASAFIEN